MAAPEIRLGSLENLPNIQLGSVQVEEVRLGNIIIWQNNLGPVFANVVWDGNTFSVPGFATTDPDVDDWSTPTYNSLASQVNGVVGTGTDESRNITLTINNIIDPDNVPGNLEPDFIVGYRLQRPDGSWAAGDPDSTATISFGAGDPAPISDYGQPLPGISTGTTYNATTDEFTTGDTTDSTSSISVALRAIDDSGTASIPSTTLVNLATQEFADAGSWLLYVIDSRGGESAEGTINVNIDYQAVTGSTVNSTAVTGAFPVTSGATISTNSASPTQYTNNRIGGPTMATLSFNNTGGPLTTVTGSQFMWNCTNCSPALTGTNPTFTVPIPQDDAGNATPAQVDLSVLGRSFDGTTATNTTIASAFLRSSPALLAPSFSVTGGGFCGPGGTVSLSYTSSSRNSAIGTFVNWNGANTGTWTGTCPATCGTTATSTSTLGTIGETRSIGGSNINSLTGTPSVSLTGDNPYTTAQCAINTPTGCASGGMTVAVTPNSGTVTGGIRADDCAGNVSAGSFGASVTYGTVAGYTIGSSSVTCNYSGGTTPATLSGPAITPSCPSITAAPGTPTLTCPTMVNPGASYSCTLSGTINFGAGQSTTFSGTCGGTGTTQNVNTGSISWFNGTTSPAQSASISCFQPVPAAPTFNAGTCTFSCAGGATLQGGGATQGVGSTGSRTCMNAGGTSAATSGTCAAPTPVCATGPMSCTLNGPSTVTAPGTATHTVSCTNTSTLSGSNALTITFLGATSQNLGGSTFSGTTVNTVINTAGSAAFEQSLNVNVSNNVAGCPGQQCTNVSLGVRVNNADGAGVAAPAAPVTQGPCT